MEARGGEGALGEQNSPPQGSDPDPGQPGGGVVEVGNGCREKRGAAANRLDPAGFPPSPAKEGTRRSSASSRSPLPPLTRER